MHLNNEADMVDNHEESEGGPAGDFPLPPQPGEPYLVALGRRRASRQRRIFADQQFYAIPEVAGRLKVKEELVRELIRRGDLHAFRVGKAYRITDDDMDEYLRSCSTRQEEDEEE
jgi:excisionase family DNA binding protein